MRDRQQRVKIDNVFWVDQSKRWHDSRYVVGSLGLYIPDLSNDLELAVNLHKSVDDRTLSETA